MAQWQDKFPQPEKTQVQSLIDQDQGRVEQLLAEQAEVEANQNEQVEVQKSYAEMVRMYPGQFAKAKKLVEEGVHDRATIARILRQEEEKKTKVPQARTVWEEGKDFKTELINDPEVSKVLTKDEIDEKFDLGYHTKYVDTIFQRVFSD